MGRLTMGEIHRLVSQLKFISLVPLTLSHIHFNSMCHSTNGHAAARQKSVVRKPQSVSVQDQIEPYEVVFTPIGIFEG